MSIKKSRLFVLVLAAAGLAVLAGTSVPANASSDKKNYPGNLCQPASDDRANDLHHDVLEGRVKNKGASALDVVCPAVADCGATYSGGHWVVVANDPEAGASVGCRLCRRDAYTGSASCGGYEWSAVTTPPGYNRQLLEPAAGTTSSYTYGVNWFYCYRPDSTHNVYIDGYGIDENC